MSLFGLGLAFFFIPKASEIAKPKTLDDVDEAPPRTLRDILRVFNPLIVFRQFMYPRVLLAVCRTRDFLQVFFAYID